MDYEETLLQVTDVLKAHNRYHMNAPDHEQAVKAIRDIVTPKGKWIITDDCEHFIAKCSICGRIEDSRMVKNYPFCRCGADMRGDEE